MHAARGCSGQWVSRVTSSCWLSVPCVWHHIAVRESVLENRMCHCDSTALSLPVRPARRAWTYTPGQQIQVLVKDDSRHVQYKTGQMAGEMGDRGWARIWDAEMGWEIYERERRGVSGKWRWDGHIGIRNEGGTYEEGNTDGEGRKGGSIYLYRDPSSILWMSKICFGQGNGQVQK